MLATCFAELASMIWGFLDFQGLIGSENEKKAEPLPNPSTT